MEVLAINLRSDFTFFVVKCIAATADSAGCSRFRNLGAPVEQSLLMKPSDPRS
jgi:hypothetical protein